MQLGRKIRDLRLRRGLTVQQLADASNLSKGFISQVENDRSSPSLASLSDLAAALQTSVAYLVVEEDQIPHMVRRDERPRLQVGGNTSKVEVLSAVPKRNLEMLLMEFPPGMSSGGNRHSHHGEECMVVIDGRIRLSCGEHVLTLEPGDSCHYDGLVPHSIENCGTDCARIMLSITPAAFEPVMSVIETRVPDREPQPQA